MRAVNTAIAALFTVSLCHAGFLVGVAFDPNSPDPQLGLPYRIDPMTGATTLITENFTWTDFGSSILKDNHLYVRASGDSPFPGTIFSTNGNDLHTVDFSTGVTTYYYAGCCGGPPELAYDSDHNVLYAGGGGWLGTIPLVYCPQGPFCPPGTTVGTFSAQIYALGYVPGDGLYGVDKNDGMLYRINGNTAALTAVGYTGIGLLIDGLSITDIEFDTSTGRIIATAGGPEPYGVGAPFPSGKIYLLDRFTGATTLLNDNAPNFFSLAEVSPEPANLILMGVGLLALGVRSRFRRNRQLPHG